MSIIIKRFTFAILAVLLIVATMSSITNYVNAQTTGGSGLRISPTRSELSLVPGDSRELIQTVRNVTQSPVTVEPVLNDFESDGVTGEPKLIGDPANISAYSLREFVVIPDSFDLQPDEEKEVTINVVVPDSASPGAYFGSILYRASPLGSGGDGQVALVASVGSLVLLEVPGDITEKIQINDISAYLNENIGSFFTKKPDSIGVEIENLGNSFSQPFGKVSVEDWRGNQVFIYELNNTSPKGNILPESTRLFVNELYNVETKTVNGEEVVEKISPIKWPGKYTITGNLSHGTTGEVFTVSSSFWYIPIWMIVVLVGVLVFLIAGAMMLYRKYITKSTKRQK